MTYYRHTGQFDPEAQKMFSILQFVRKVGWNLCLALLIGAVCTIIYDKTRSRTFPKPIELRRMVPTNPKSTNDPILRILSETG